MENMVLTESPIGMWAAYIGVRDETLEKQDDPGLCLEEYSPRRVCEMKEVPGLMRTPVAVRFHTLTFSFVVEDEDGMTVGFPIQNLTMREKRDEASGMLSTLRKMVSGESDPPDFLTWIIGDGGDSSVKDE